MKKEFPGYFSGGDAELEKIWDECIFVLDANVLLNLYRYSDFTCSKLFEVFNSLSSRLWVPHQVVYEYLNNRLPVIGEQGKVYEDAVKKVDSLRKSLENHNQHPFISAETLADSMRLFEKIVAELAENKISYEKRIYADEIKDQLEKLLEGKVGEGFSRERLDSIIVDGKGRYEQKIPPGYCDVKKGGDSIVFADICRPYGDYIVWLQIIEQAKSTSKPVVFITGDAKDDWWASFQGKTLGPHPQLVQEFLQLVGQNFYMYPPDRFLETAIKYLKQDASDQAVNEIRDIRKEDLESAILDKALNFAWPESSPPAVRPKIPGALVWPEALTDLPWNEKSELSISHEFRLLSELRSNLLLRGQQVKEQLTRDLAERESIAVFQKGLFVSGVTVDENALSASTNHMNFLNGRIEMLRAELSELRDEMSTLIARQKAAVSAEKGAKS